jgi:phosphoglycolate phosphatase
LPKIYYNDDLQGKEMGLIPPVLLFDLDGTLTDPKPGITGCIRFALENLKASCPTDDLLARYIGPPLRRTFAELLSTTDTEVIENAITLYRQRFADIGLYENEVYEGIPELLEQTKEAAVYIATAKPRVYAERIVAHFGMSHHFQKVYGAELDGRWENKADLLRHLFAEENILPEDAVMIGDRAVDIEAARANGVASIGVLWGYGTHNELEKAGADHLCRTPDELSLVLKNSFRPR